LGVVGARREGAERHQGRLLPIQRQISKENLGQFLRLPGVDPAIRTDTKLPLERLDHAALIDVEGLRDLARGELTVLALVFASRSVFSCAGAVGFAVTRVAA